MALAQKARYLFQAAICILSVTIPTLAQETVSLVGSGSNLVNPLYTEWTSQFGKQHPNIQARYLGLGTSQSLAEIRQGTGDFGGGEIPLTEAQKHGGKYTLAQFPTVLVAIVPIYKLPGKPELKFSGQLLAEIYLGNIKNWQDPQIAKLNPGVALPDLPITVVHLSGVKGSNYIFSEFLSKTSSEWKSKVGKSSSPNWPVGVEVPRSEGLVNKVSATPGAIGYVEMTYAKRKDIGFGTVQNAAGQFVRATSTGILAACAANAKSLPDDFGASLTNAPGKESYPLTSFTWIYVPSTGLPLSRAEALKSFWNWTLSDGQEIATGLGYTALPSEVASKAREALNSVH